MYTISSNMRDVTEIQIGLSVFIFLLILLQVLKRYYKERHNPYKPPPGPWGFPIVGNILQVGSKPHLSLTKMSKKYGNVFQIHMGAKRTVVISGLETIRKALLQDATSFAGRPDLWTFRFFGEKPFGFANYDERYRLHRKIARHALYMFTNNKDTPVEVMAQKEALQIVKDLLAENGQPQDPKSGVVATAACSIVYSICFGPRQNLRDDDKLNQFIQAVSEGNLRPASSFVADFIPITRPFLEHTVKRFAEATTQLKKVNQEKVEEHNESYSDNMIRDSLDALIKATKQYNQEEKEKVGLTDQQILDTTRSFVGAGTGTISAFLSWALLYMIKFPEIQIRIQSEIDDVIGQEIMPSIKHRSVLPYTDATIWEIFRHSVPLPFLLPHATVNDTVLNNFFIKKETFVMFNMWSISRDKKLWANPEQFNPEHFLDDSGQLDKEKVEWILPFGAGKRRCIGELLGKVEMFIMFTTLLQKCNFTALPGEQISIEPVLGFGNETAPYQLTVTPRSV